jgi:photosystem II stability/assembly factor-like uncharacterized protein
MKFLVLAALIANLAAGQSDQATFQGMKYRLVGPFRGGRVLAVAGVAGDPLTYYFGAASGGVFKTTDGGVTWKPVSDGQPFASTGAIAVAPSDPNVIYVGSGEGCLRGNVSYGNGVYKSTDAGKTWKNVGLRDSRQIGRLIVHPRNPDVAFVAAIGHAFGPNSERGVFRTTDGGASWSKVLFKDDRTGAVDIAFDPTNPNVLFAALYQVQRMPYGFTSGGPGSGLYRSTDGGTSWTQVQGNGLPKGNLGRIGIAVADSSRIYALIEAEQAGLYRSDDGGGKWELVNTDERFHQRAWYFTHVFADPKNPDAVYILNTGMFRSPDGGKTFKLLPAPHGDHHGLWIDPTNPLRMINGDDGGATISVDGGKNWTQQMNQPTAQFYHVAADNRFPYYLFGAQQDNSSLATASWSDEGIIGPNKWYVIAGGESATHAPDPRDGNVVYSAGQGVARFDKRTEQGYDISPVPLDWSGHGVEDMPHRFQWTEPIFVSPHDAKVLYTAGEVVFRSGDEGKSWQVISPDLTRNDKSKQKASGGELTKDNTSVEYYDTIFALAESPKQKGVLWAGSDDGLIHISRNGGQKWDNVTPKQMAEWSMISIIDPSPHDAGTAWVAVDRHKLDDLKAYIYVTRDSGQSWTAISEGIPEGSFVRSVREDPKKKGLLYAGTETGVFVSLDAGAHWQPLRLNLPTVPVHDLVVKDDDLAVATHGRAFWILDDLSPLRQYSPDTMLYKPRASYHIRFPDQVNKRQPVGENPPPGALIYYSLKEKPAQEVTLEFLDAQGKVARRFSSIKKGEVRESSEWPDAQHPDETLPVEVGLNRFNWDQYYEGPVQVPGAVYVSDNPPKGPFALPGQYQVKLTIGGGKSYTSTLEIKPDPRLSVSQADLEKQFALETRISEKLATLHTTVNHIRYLRLQLTGLNRRLGDAEQFKPIQTAADELLKKISAVEELLLQTKMKSTEGNLAHPSMIDEQLIFLGSSVDAADAAPTEGQNQVFEWLSRRLQEQLREWDNILSKDVSALNRLMDQKKMTVLDSQGAPKAK